MTSLVLIGLYSLPVRHSQFISAYSPSSASRVKPVNHLQGFFEPISFHASLLQPSAVMAQRLRASDIAEMVYRQHPELPRANQYISTESGDVDEDNTLMSRLIRYHLYVAQRFPVYRLDWKLTFADYLGANEWIFAEQYPGAADLRTNPRDQDLAAIQQLNRAERDAVIDTLVEIFSSDGARLPGFRGGIN